MLRLPVHLCKTLLRIFYKNLHFYYFFENIIEMSQSYVPKQLDKNNPATEMKLVELLKTQNDGFVIALTEDNQEGTSYLMIVTIDGRKQWVAQTTL